MAAFQSCKDEAKLRISATHMLGRCFAASGWHGEATGEYRDALQSLGAGESDRELPIRYDLMVSLMDGLRIPWAATAVNNPTATANPSEYRMRRLRLIVIRPFLS